MGRHKIDEPTPEEAAEALAEAMRSGLLLNVECLCTRWILHRDSYGQPCGHCSEPMIDRSTPFPDDWPAQD